MVAMEEMQIWGDLGWSGHPTGPSDLLWPTRSSCQILGSTGTLTVEQDTVTVATFRELALTPLPCFAGSTLKDPGEPRQ